jgi:HTH-type transcriptional regulator, pleiotropic regulator of extracellular virulence genes
MDQAFFQRYRVEDRKSLGHRVDILRARLASAIEAGNAAEEMRLKNQLGFDLTPLDREAEAVTYLESALELAQRLADRSLEIEILLNLATARQYLGERDIALELFEKALAKSSEYNLHDHDGFILHHRGRCYAEQGDLAAARHAFGEALELRRKIGTPRFIDSTKRALATLDDMERAN